MAVTESSDIDINLLARIDDKVMETTESRISEVNAHPSTSSSSGRTSDMAGIIAEIKRLNERFDQLQTGLGLIREAVHTTGVRARPGTEAATAQLVVFLPSKVAEQGSRDVAYHSALGRPADRKTRSGTRSDGCLYRE